MKKTICFATVALWTFAGSAVYAQGQGKSKKRRPVAETKLKPRQGVTVRDFSPKSGPAKTVVTIRGTALRRVTKIGVGPVLVTPDEARPRMLRFTLPEFKKPGARRLVLHADGKRVDVGRFAVTVAKEPTPSTPPDSTAELPTRPPTTSPGTRRPRPPRARHRRTPTVSGFHPKYGGPGTRVVIRGRNFTPEVKLRFGGELVQPEKITPRKIVFKTPKQSRNGMIKLRVKDKVRPIVVGRFDVKRKWDPGQVAKRRAEQRARAEKRWQARRAKQVKDKAERRKQWVERQRQLRENRAERRKQERAKLRAKWKRALLQDPDVLAELSLHAERSARLQRMLRLAEVDDRSQLVVRIEVAIERENRRHENRMMTLKAAVQSGQEGQP